MQEVYSPLHISACMLTECMENRSRHKSAAITLWAQHRHIEVWCINSFPIIRNIQKAAPTIERDVWIRFVLMSQLWHVEGLGDFGHVLTLANYEMVELDYIYMGLKAHIYICSNLIGHAFKRHICFWRQVLKALSLIYNIWCISSIYYLFGLQI